MSVFTCSGRRRLTAAVEKQEVKLHTAETEPAAKLTVAAVAVKHPFVGTTFTQPYNVRILTHRHNVVPKKRLLNVKRQKC